MSEINNKKGIKLSNKFIIFMGIVIIFLGFLILFKDYFKSKKMMIYENMYFTLTDQPTYNESSTEEVEELDNDIITNELGEDVFIDKDYYIGRIEIPNIHLVKGFCDKYSKWNDVKNNVAVMSGASYPDINNGNFILAAHAGTAWNSYFGQLYKLNIGDYAYVYYDGYKYSYKLVNIYDVDKTGYVKIYRNRNINALTLITCTQNNMKKKQTVYIFELTEKSINN